VKCLEPDAIAAVEQQLDGHGAHRGRALLDARASRRPVGKDGLEMPAAQPAARAK
jgi:hypothetical protein